MDKTFIQLVVVSVPLYTVLILGEIAFSHFFRQGLYSLKGTLTNIWLNGANFLLDLLMRGTLLFVLAYFYRFHFIHFNNPWVYWLMLLLLEDLAFYFLHRVDHYCRLFWAVHVTHHSSEEFNLTVGFRSSVFQPLYRFIWFIPLALFGFNAWDILLMYSITQLYGTRSHIGGINRMNIAR